jgi:hypothetical protein
MTTLTGPRRTGFSASRRDRRPACRSSMESRQSSPTSLCGVMCWPSGETREDPVGVKRHPVHWLCTSVRISAILGAEVFTVHRSDASMLVLFSAATLSEGRGGVSVSVRSVPAQWQSLGLRGYSRHRTCRCWPLAHKAPCLGSLYILSCTPCSNCCAQSLKRRRCPINLSFL